MPTINPQRINSEVVMVVNIKVYKNCLKMDALRRQQLFKPQHDYENAIALEFTKRISFVNRISNQSGRRSIIDREFDLRNDRYKTIRFHIQRLMK